MARRQRGADERGGRFHQSSAAEDRTRGVAAADSHDPRGRLHAEGSHMVGMTIGRRLTLWYGAFWALSLAALAVCLYLLFSHNLLAEIDRALEEELAEIETEVVAASDVE